MQKRTLILFISAIFIVSLSNALSAGQNQTNKGAETMQLESGRLPSVPFPHHMHQEMLDDCNVCHDRFPQSRGAIKEMQAQGKIKKQEVMNENCISCHKERQRAGKPSGPLSCTDCHPR